MSNELTPEQVARLEKCVGFVSCNVNCTEYRDDNCIGKQHDANVLLGYHRARATRFESENAALRAKLKAVRGKIYKWSQILPNAHDFDAMAKMVHGKELLAILDGEAAGIDGRKDFARHLLDVEKGD